jgi:4-hydroxybenzoate polyprenyltransferase
VNGQHARIESERVVVAAPMSLTGSTIRIWRAMGERGAAWWSRALWVTGAVLALIVAWAVVLCWYAVFGVFLVPYRVSRRHSRKRRVEALRHRESLGR